MYSSLMQCTLDTSRVCRGASTYMPAKYSENIQICVTSEAYSWDSKTRDFPWYHSQLILTEFLLLAESSIDHSISTKRPSRSLTASSDGKFGSAFSNMRTESQSHLAHSEPTSSSSSSSTSPQPNFNNKVVSFSRKFSESRMTKRKTKNKLKLQSW